MRINTAMGRKPSGCNGFSKMERPAFLKLCQTAVRSKRLKPSDWLLLCRLAAEASPRTGRIEQSVLGAAEDVGLNPAHARASMKRLKDLDLIRKGRTACGYFFMANPLFFNTVNTAKGDEPLEKWIQRYQQLEGPARTRRVPARGLQRTLQAA